jgi:putative ABC transport system permease protein
VERALGAQSGLRVQTLAERRAQYAALSRQGLVSLSQISALLLIAAALAVASALSAAIWQRRPRLAALKIQGFDRRQLWRALLLESGIVLTVGCSAGAILGIYGHALASRYLQTTTGFPAPFSLGGAQLLFPLALVVGIALAVVALPGWMAARVPAQVSFQE